MSIGAGVRYFREDLRENERDNAISGPDIELQVGPLTIAKPVSGDGPGSYKIGRSGLGFGGSYTSEKLIDGTDTLKAATDLLIRERLLFYGRYDK